MFIKDRETPFEITTIIVLFAFILVFIRGLTVFLQRRIQDTTVRLTKNATIIVMGDIGRSPRMQYHALSFAQNGWTVDFVGYEGAKPLDSIANNSKIKIHYVSHPWQVPGNFSKWLFILYAPIKVYFQILLLYWILLMKINSPDVVLVQNPPSIPTLMIAQFVCWLRQTNIIIDWHNFGYTILGLRLGQDSRVVKFAKWYEKLYGGRAYAHLTVTAKMHRELMYNWEVRGAIATLYDRPPTNFRRLELEEIHEFLTRFNLERIVSEQTIDSHFLPESTLNSTLLTTKVSPTDPAKYRADRPILIVSSTSWTADEDFSILLQAAQICDQFAVTCAEKNSKKFPKLLFVITGEGPLKNRYVEEISKMSMDHVRIVTTWLPAEDYPLLLGSADLGLCLHTSSSGMDLPMKIVDMFGCGLPVCAVEYDCLGELVNHNKNGLIFKNSEQLAQQLTDLFTDYPANMSKLESMRKHVIEYQKERWETNWNRTVLPLLNTMD